MRFLLCKYAVLKYVCGRRSAPNPAGEAYSASMQITVITVIFCCDNLWKSKLRALQNLLENPGNFFSYSVATL